MKNNTIQRGGAIALAKTLSTGLGKILCLLLILSVFALALTQSALGAVPYITPAASYIDGSTNTVSVGGSNVLVSVVQAGYTNAFNLSTTPRAQGNTNFWPALPLFDPKITTPYQRLDILHQYSLMTSNGANQTVRYAATPDNGVHWFSNACVVIMNTNGAYASTLVVNNYIQTNKSCATAWCVQAVENPGVSAITNLSLTPVALPGF